MFGKLLCRIGLHAYDFVSLWGPHYEVVKCRRCGKEKLDVL